MNSIARAFLKVADGRVEERIKQGLIPEFIVLGSLKRIVGYFSYGPLRLRASSIYRLSRKYLNIYDRELYTYVYCKHGAIPEFTILGNFKSSTDIVYKSMRIFFSRTTRIISTFMTENFYIHINQQTRWYDNYRKYIASEMFISRTCE